MISNNSGGDENSLEHMRTSGLDEFMQHFQGTGVGAETREKIGSLLRDLQQYHLPTYHHSIRVGLLAQSLALMQNGDKNTGLWAALHDIGKRKIPLSLLNKKGDFNEDDRKNMDPHVTEGYQILCEAGLRYSAWISLTHHRYQRRSYPSEEKMSLFSLPILLENPKNSNYLINETITTALADCYDAATTRGCEESFRRDSSDSWLKPQLMDQIPSHKEIVKRAYEKRIFV